ncbi:hypothetical protein GGI15_002176 [Coemansia interrupta]|uniref:Uncharacterized protein n=1 Tax=Coemansia interrupta TaxID=1126814 RepID=A0A9W8HM11_9FUNG|nr:hypothetical protein GGI15_002176 [Coemansia interrupta]
MIWSMNMDYNEELINVVNAFGSGGSVAAAAAPENPPKADEGSDAPAPQSSAPAS